jgi:hypothetical protein
MNSRSITDIGIRWLLPVFRHLALSIRFEVRDRGSVAEGSGADKRFGSAKEFLRVRNLEHARRRYQQIGVCC